MSRDYNDQRAGLRCLSEANARVIRELDPIRFEILGRVQDLSSTGVCLVLSTPLEVGEFISIWLENPIQKAKVKTRGEVTRLEPLAEGSYRVGVALLRRLTPREVQDQGKFQAWGA